MGKLGRRSLSLMSTEIVLEQSFSHLSQNSGGRKNDYRGQDETGNKHAGNHR